MLGFVRVRSKMRKPDSEPGSSTGTKKRSSMSAKSQTQMQPLPAEEQGSQPSLEVAPPREKTAKRKSSTSTNHLPPLPIDDPEPRSSFEVAPPHEKTAKRKPSASTNSHPPPLPNDDPEPRSSFEAVPAPPSRSHSQPQEIKSRPASASPMPRSYSETQTLPPRPASRPASTSTSFRPISSSHAYVTTTPGPNSSATTTIKRKKSRPYVDPDDYESDGAQADAEFGGTGLTNGWVNIDGRRKSILHGHGGAGSSRERERILDVDEGRRHSMAV